MESDTAPHPETSPTPNTAPVMDVVPPPFEKPDDEDSPDASKKDKKLNKVTPKKADKPKQPSSGAGLAIFATIIIVLGLAALATYAYLKTR